MIVGSRLVAREDGFQNIVFMRIFSDENKYDVGATIFLKLKSEGRRRNVGNLYLHDHSFHVTRNSQKHYHYATKGYGFNWKIILKAKRVSDPAYKAKIISLVLIDKALNNIKNMDRSDVDVIIGRENAILVNDFYLSY